MLKKINRNRTSQGFTILELMVVIAIISILTAIAFVSIGRIQKEARDKDRDSDTTIIMNAMEKFYDKNGEYPYGISLNPTASWGKLPNYDAVKANLPGIVDAVLNGPSTGNDFIPITCATPPSCTISAPDRLLKPKQYIYITALQTYSGYSWNFNSTGDMWGCQITFSDTSPASVLAWRSEVTGKWTFKKSRHGDATIANYSTGPITPTVCAFS